MRKLPTLRVSLIAAVVGLLLVPATSLSSFVVRDSRSRFVFFSGARCGATATRTLGLPPAAFDVVPTALPVGSVLRSLDDDTTPVARITAVTVGSGAVAWTATGSDAACTDPLFTDFGWDTNGDDIRASYSRRITRAYLPAKCAGPRYRPRTIIVACGDGNLQLRGLRWKGWNGRVARARGVALISDCDPYCAAGRFHRLAVRVTVSRPRQCRGVYQYMRLRYRLVRRSLHFRRSGGTSFGWTCSS